MSINTTAAKKYKTPDAIAFRVGNDWPDIFEIKGEECPTEEAARESLMRATMAAAQPVYCWGKGEHKTTTHCLIPEPPTGYKVLVLCGFNDSTGLDYHDFYAVPVYTRIKAAQKYAGCLWVSRGDAEEMAETAENDENRSLQSSALMWHGSEEKWIPLAHEVRF